MRMQRFRNKDLRVGERSGILSHAILNFGPKKRLRNPNLQPTPPDSARCGHRPDLAVFVRVRVRAAALGPGQGKRGRCF